MDRRCEGAFIRRGMWCWKLISCLGRRSWGLAVATVVIAATIDRGGWMLCANSADAAENAALPLAKTPFAAPYMYARIPGAPADSRGDKVAVARGGGLAFAIVTNTTFGSTGADAICHVLRPGEGQVSTIEAADAHAFAQAAISPDGKALALWAYSTNRFLRDSPLRCYTTRADFPAGSVWDLRGSAAASQDAVTSGLKFSPSGKSLVVCGCYDGITILDAPELRLQAEIPVRNSLYSIECSISHDGRYAAMLTEGTHNRPSVYSNHPVPGAKPSTATDTVIVQLLELQTGQIFGKIPDHESVSDLTFASNGAMLAFVARDRGRDSVVVWDTVRGRRVAKLDGLPEQEAQLNDCRFLPNSNILAVAENRARIVFFAIPSCRRLGTIEHVQVDAFAFCPDGCELVVGDRDAVAGWHLDRNKLRGSAPAKSPVQTKEPPITKEALSRSYDALAGFDAHRAMEAIAQLCSAPGEASAFIAEKMQPATVDRVQVARWIGELDSNDPAIRENACKGLERIALAACGQLRKAEESAVSLEVRLKLHRILADTQEYRIRDVECIRALRAIQCLEVIGGEKARAALARLSEGEPESIITREAKAAAMRLADWLQAD